MLSVFSAANSSISKIAVFDNYSHNHKAYEVTNANTNGTKYKSNFVVARLIVICDNLIYPFHWFFVINRFSNKIIGR